MIVRRVRFGEDPTTMAPAAAEDGDVDVRVKPSTAAAGLALWVSAGVLTHLAIRMIDGWLDGRRKH